MESKATGAAKIIGGWVEVEMTQDGRSIILRGSKEDVETTVIAIRNAEKGTGAKTIPMLDVHSIDDDVESGMQADRLERERRIVAPIEGKIEMLDPQKGPTRDR